MRLLPKRMHLCTVRNIFMTRTPAFFVQCLSKSLAGSAARVCWLLLAGQGRWSFLFLVDVFVRFFFSLFFPSFFFFCSFVVVFVVFGSSCFFLSPFFPFCVLFFFLFLPPFSPFSFCVLFPAPSFALLALLLVLPHRFGLAGVEYYWRLPILFAIFSFSIWFLTGCWSIKSSVHS